MPVNISTLSNTSQKMLNIIVNILYELFSNDIVLVAIAWGAVACIIALILSLICMRR